MEPVLVISLTFIVLAVGGLGCAVGLYFARARSNTEKGTVARLAAELAAHQEAQVEGVVDLVLGVAGESFDSRLERFGAVERSMTEKVESVDKLVAERVGGMSKNLGQQVTTMTADLGQLRLLVTQLQKERAQQHGQFVESMEAATRDRRFLTETTGRLSDALASNQARGQWGERMAEDVLRQAGMREGVNYDKQSQIGAGGTRPDFTFRLPDDRLLHMDVKFPFDNYLRYLEAPSEVEKVARLDRFLKDVRARVKELTGRGYAASDTTVGYLLLFIPNESVYGFIHENDTTLLDDAFDQKVVLCSPTSLFSVLCIIRQVMDTLRVERSTGEILETLTGFIEQWEKFSGQIDKVERHIETLSNSFNELAGPRRRQLERHLARIDDIRQHTLDDGVEPLRDELSASPLSHVSDIDAD